MILLGLPKTIIYEKNRIYLLDQRYLPFKTSFFECNRLEDVVFAIKSMVIRGAPLIGVVASFGFYLGIKDGKDPEEIYDMLLSTRPTAVNLSWSLNRVKSLYEKDNDIDAVYRECIKIYEEDIETNRLIGEIGSDLLSDGDTVLTHCNAGALATAGYGTALGVIRAAVEQGKSVSVIADETRPRLQGALLTVYELYTDRIPVKLISDMQAGYLMRKGIVNKVIVGADRISRNGDVANKVGTFMIALAAKYFKIPFYVAAPLSTVDIDIDSGEQIAIEERSEEEIKKIRGIPITLDDVGVYNYAFDITPSELITAIITEKGIFKPQDIYLAFKD